jgi:hypothetical protein
LPRADRQFLKKAGTSCPTLWAVSEGRALSSRAVEDGRVKVPPLHEMKDHFGVKPRALTQLREQVRGAFLALSDCRRHRCCSVLCVRAMRWRSKVAVLSAAAAV